MRPPAHCTPKTTCLALGIGVLLWCSEAFAHDSILATAQPQAPEPQAQPQDGKTSPDRPAPESAPRPLRIGAIGGVGFPRPLAVEAMAVMGGVAALGIEYGVLPATSIDGVSVSLWSLSGDARVFPFRGPFFIGLRAGHQHLEGSTTVVVRSIGSASETLGLDSWFLNPRLGFLWISREGLALGVEAGVQFPVSTSQSSTLPLSLVPSAQSTADTLGNSVLPTVDLLRIGLIL
jgi:hypothetical protein